MINFKLSLFSTLAVRFWFRLFLDFILGLLVSLFIFKTFTLVVPVFGFHGIFDTETPLSEIRVYDYSKQQLKAFLENLVQDNYWFLSTQEVYDYFLSQDKKVIPPEHKKEKPIVISFDDGYKNAHDHLMEILPELEKRYNKKVKIVFFINPGFMGKEGTYHNHASCQDLREGFTQGYYDLQSHGQNHENLTKISLTKVDSELSRAQKDLKACLENLDTKGEVGNHFAYPYGAANKEVEKLTAKYYQSSYLYNSRILRPFTIKDLYRVSRLTVNRKTSLQMLQLKAGGNWF